MSCSSLPAILTAHARTLPANPAARAGLRVTLSRALAAGLLACAGALPAPAVAQADEAASRAADRARAHALEAEAKTLRSEAEATYEATVPGCYARFLVNRCIDQARQARLDTIQRARALEAEARRLDLAERQRVAAEAAAQTLRTPAPAAPGALPEASVATPPRPGGDARIEPAPEAERIRAQREAQTRAAEAAAAGDRAAAEAERAADRRKVEEEAARRARQAAEDRARYDERIREYEKAQQRGK